MGKRTCGTCAGSGRVMVIDPETNRPKPDACHACGGSGVVPTRD